MTPDRLFDNHSPSSRRAHLVTAALAVMTAGVVFLSGVVVFAIVTGDPGEERIEQKLDDQLDLIQSIIEAGRIAGAANTCTNFQNQRAIELAVRDIATLNGIKAGPLRVRASRSTVQACRAAGVPIEDGVPVAGVLPGD